MKKILIVIGLIILLIVGYFGYNYYFPADLEIVEENIFENVDSNLNQESVDFNQNLESNENTLVNGENVSSIEDIDTQNSVQNEIQDSSLAPQLIFENEFEKIDYDIEGSYKIYKLEDGSYAIRIEDLDVQNGPDLHFVLTNEFTSSLDDYEIISGPDIDGEKFANKGSYNIEVPEGVNVEDYKYLVVHCVQYNHAFAGAELK